MTSPGMLHRERLRQGVEGEIPPRYDDAHLLTRQLLAHCVCRGDGRRSSSLGEHSRRLEQGQNAATHFHVRYQPEIVQSLPEDLGREAERNPRRQSLGKRVRPVNLLQLTTTPCLIHNRRADRLYADDTQPWRKALSGKASAGQPGAATGGDDQHIQIWHGFQHLYGIRRNSRNETPIVCRWDKVCAPRGRIALGLGSTLVEIPSGEAHLSSQSAHRCDFQWVGLIGHPDGRRHAELARRVRDRLPVIAGRGRDDSPCALFRRELAQEEETTTDLERTHGLEVFAFEKRLKPKQRVERRSCQQGRRLQEASNDLARPGDVGHRRQPHTRQRIDLRQGERRGDRSACFSRRDRRHPIIPHGGSLPAASRALTRYSHTSMLAPGSMAALSQERRLYVHSEDQNSPFRDGVALGVGAGRVERSVEGEATVSSTFGDRLIDAVRTNGSLLCVGLDPVQARFPGPLGDEPDVTRAIVSFNAGVIAATSDLVCAYKPNLGFYLAYGAAGVAALEETRRL